jgi:putative membrane protein
VHFAYGLLVTPAAVEIFAHCGRYPRPWVFLLPWMFMAGHAVIYELIEFAAALVFGGDLGQAYLGTQGDIWDGQKDMALALLGTTLMLAAIGAAGRLPTKGRKG